MEGYTNPFNVMTLGESLSVSMLSHLANILLYFLVYHVMCFVNEFMPLLGAGYGNSESEKFLGKKGKKFSHKEETKKYGLLREYRVSKDFKDESVGNSFDE